MPGLDPLDLSVIVPAYNEEACLPALVEALQAALKPLGQSYEIILVDDLSTDQTATVINKLSQSNAEVVGVFHIIRSGQSAAVVSGMHRSRGKVLATLDADMQNPPSEIPRLLAHLTEGVDAVFGVRRKRNDSAIRRFSSKAANSYRNLITGVQVQDAGCALRVMRRDAVKELPVFNGLHRFIPTLMQIQGYVVKEVPVEHSQRLAGQSKYGIGNRMWRGIIDCFAMRWYAKRAISPKRTK